MFAQINAEKGAQEIRALISQKAHLLTQATCLVNTLALFWFGQLWPLLELLLNWIFGKQIRLRQTVDQSAVYALSNLLFLDIYASALPTSKSVNWFCLKHGQHWQHWQPAHFNGKIMSSSSNQLAISQTCHFINLSFHQLAIQMVK